MAIAFDGRSSLVGAVLGLVVGGVAVFVSMSLAHVEPPATPAPTEALLSYAQQGEDLVLHQLTVETGIKNPTYLDIGAHEPVISNNTYIFYLRGARGVLVEPNPTFAQKIRTSRPGDVVLEVGVGVTGEAEADYYLMGQNGQLNTFSKTQVDALVHGRRARLEGVIKRRLVPINQIMEDHFKDRAPDILSVDIEGLDLAILKSLDWNRWRPRIICVETSTAEDGRVDAEILTLLESKGYTVRGGSFVNTIFLDERTWRAELAAARDAH